MVLGEPGDRVPEPVGQPRLLGDFAKHLRRRLVRFARPHQIEDPEIHRLILHFSLLSQPWLRYAPGVKGARVTLPPSGGDRPVRGPPSPSRTRLTSSAGGAIVARGGGQGGK